MQQGSDCSSPRLVRLFEGGYDALKLALKSVLVVMTLSMSAMITYQVISRYFFNAPSALTEGLLRYALIWLGLLGAGYCFMERRHLNLPLVLDVISPGKAAFLKAVNMWLMLIFGAILVWSGY